MDLTFKNVQNLCARVDLSVQRPIINLADVTWFEPYALIYLGMFLRHHNRNGVYFEIVNPARADANSYLSRQNFWNRFNFTPKQDDSDLLRFWPNTSFNDIIDLEKRMDQAENVGAKLKQILQSRGVKVDIENVTIAVEELVQNFVEHSDEGLAAIMGQYYPNHHKLCIAIGDCGVGIKRSLTMSGQYPSIEHMPHKDAIVEALQRGVTSKHEGGMGFDVVKDIVEEHNGEFFLSSNNGCIYQDKHGKLYKMDVPYDLPGVQIELCFPERR